MLFPQSPRTPYNSSEGGVFTPKGMQAAKEKTNLEVAGLDIEVTVNDDRAAFQPTTATPQNLGRVQTAIKDWLASLGYSGTATISGGAVVAEVTGHTFSAERDRKGRKLSDSHVHPGQGQHGSGWLASS